MKDKLQITAGKKPRLKICFLREYHFKNFAIIKVCGYQIIRLYLLQYVTSHKNNVYFLLRSCYTTSHFVPIRYMKDLLVKVGSYFFCTKCFNTNYNEYFY